MNAQTFQNSPYLRAVEMIRSRENCTLVEAMRKTQDLHPGLYEQFLAQTPRGKI